MNRPADDKTVVIRGGWGSHLKALLGGIGFVVVGVLMLTLPPPTRSVLPWSEPIQHIIGVLSIVFGGVGLAALLYRAIRAMTKGSKGER